MDPLFRLEHMLSDFQSLFNPNNFKPFSDVCDRFDQYPTSWHNDANL